MAAAKSKRSKKNMEPQKKKLKTSSPSKNIKKEKRQKKVKLPASPTKSHQKSLNLLDLPDKTLRKILIHLSCNEIASLRVVCRRFYKVCASTLMKEFKLLEVRLLRLLTEGRITLLQYDGCISGDQLKRYDMLDKIDSILSKTLTHVQTLRKTIGLSVKGKNHVFFPGKIIDTVYDIMCTLLDHMKGDKIHEEVPYYLQNGEIDTSHLDKLVDKALDYFNISVKTKRFNFRRSTTSQM